MTTYEAYDAGFPCANKKCASYGSPHPNCKCYGTFSEGGDVHFCSEARVHDPSCQYYKSGGEVTLPPQALDPSEESKWAMGQEDKEQAVASALLHSGASHLLAGDMKGAYGESDKGLKGIAAQKFTKKLQKYLPQGIDVAIKKVLGDHPNKLAAPLLAKMLSQNEVHGFDNVLSYANNVKRGSKSIDSAIESLFDGKHEFEKPDPDRVKKIDEFVSHGTLLDQMNQPQTQMMADGGEVKPEKSIFAGTKPMATILPEHNMLIQEAKGRVNNYLNALRPVKNQGLAFDKSYENPETRRSYDKALELAEKPINILNQVRSGKITSNDVLHLRGLYPEIHNHLSKKMTERIVKAQMNEEQPPYHTRQGMSLFLGAPLDSSFSPSAILAAQATFNQSQPQQQAPPTKAKKSTKPLDKISSLYETPQQAANLREIQAK